MDGHAIKNDLTNLVKNGVGIPLGLIIIISMMVLPIPPFILDIFFTFSITLSLLVLLAGIYCLRPLDFAVFPTVLLLTTLLRLALNVASTRVVLLNGHAGTGAAGHVIESFGQVVIGGSYAVGLVVFTILVIINFVVVTKGAGRISEVSARFTLDALPGKQMAIDADLNAGLINQEEAKERRRELSEETDFYGSMDGASKFVRGDAIAGILILLINLLGGVFIGVVQHKLSFMQAMEIYALLTIGDGLVAQIPALILSTSAAMMVTRVSRSEDMGKQLLFQVFLNPKPLMVTAGILISLGLIPGMPHYAFIGLGAIVGIASYLIFKPKKIVQEQEQIAKEEQEKEIKENLENKEITWDDVPNIDILGLEIGYRLISLVDKNQSGELMGRIKGVRKKLSQEFGFLVPSVHIRDNLELAPNGYRISVLGVIVGEDKIFPDKNLAINPGQVFGKLEGTAAKEPSFGLDAYWVDANQKQHAQTLGYTVVDSSTVIATHLSKIISDHAYQLVGYEEVQKILNNLSKDAPKLVEDLVPKILTLGVVVKVIQSLLYERVPIRDMRTIVEVLSIYGQKTQDHIALVEAVRVAIGPMIVQDIIGFSRELSVMTLDPSLEQILQKSVQENEGNTIVIEPGLAEKLQTSLKECVQKQEVSGIPPVLLVSSNIRLLMAKFIRSITPQLKVLSYQEIPEDKQICVVASIGGN